MRTDRTHPHTASTSDQVRFDVVLDDHDRDHVRLRCSGEIEPTTADRLFTAVADVLATPGRALVELDLAEVAFVDSSGVRALARSWELAARHRCRLVVSNPAPVVAQVLGITGIDSLLASTADPGADPGGDGRRRARPPDPAAVPRTAAPA